MSKQCSYITVGIAADRENPVVAMGKRNASFEVGGIEFERTGTLKLPETMTSEEFDEWKSMTGADLLDIFFHCIKQRGIRAGKPSPAGEEQSELMTDGGTERYRILKITDNVTALAEGSLPLRARDNGRDIELKEFREVGSEMTFDYGDGELKPLQPHNFPIEVGGYRVEPVSRGGGQ